MTAKTLLLISALLTAATAAASAQADVVQTRIFRVEAPSAPGQEHQVLSTRDGRVYFVAPEDGQLLSKLAALKAQGAPANLVLDGDRVIDAQPLTQSDAAEYRDDFDQPRVANDAFEALGPDSYAEAGDAEKAELPQSLARARAIGYQPTILDSVADAQALFSTERELNHHSQCYERAEVWTREFQQSRGVYSMKVFMFFTSRFRNRYTHNVLFFTRPYKWWFHVAPFVYVGNQEYVLDREFINQAVLMDDWTFQFIGKVEHDNKDVPNPTRGEAACLDAVSYAQYSQDPNPARYCVLRKVPMYYFQPLDVEALDLQRTIAPNWRDSELKRAYKDTAK